MYWYSTLAKMANQILRIVCYTLLLFVYLCHLGPPLNLEKSNAKVGCPCLNIF